MEALALRYPHGGTPSNRPSAGRPRRGIGPGPRAARERAPTGARPPPGPERGRDRPGRAKDPEKTTMNSPPRELVDQLLVEQAESWRRGQRVLVEQYLERHPSL